MKFVKYFFVWLFILSAIQGCTKQDISNKPTEETVTLILNKEVKLEAPVILYICFSGYVSENVLAFEMDCGFRNSRQIFLFKDNSSHGMDVNGERVFVEFVETNPSSVTLRFYQ